MTISFHKTRFLLCVLLLTLLTGCAVNPKQSDDRYESFNRSMYNINHALDSVVVKPVATVYHRLIPSFVRNRVTQFFKNIDMLTTVPNDLLQAKGKFALSDTWRFVLNSTLGLGGMFDVASHMGLPPHTEDFGLTLNTWGAKRSTYVFLPILGPSTGRDTVGDIMDLFVLSPWPYIHPRWISYAAYGLDLLNARSQLLEVDPLLKTALDRYVFVREAYLQNRAEQIRVNHLSYSAYKAHLASGGSEESVEAPVDLKGSDTAVEPPVDLSGTDAAQ